MKDRGKIKWQEMGWGFGGRDEEWGGGDREGKGTGGGKRSGWPVTPPEQCVG